LDVGHVDSPEVAGGEVVDLGRVEIAGIDQYRVGFGQRSLSERVGQPVGVCAEGESQRGAAQLAPSSAHEVE
jgi:hypothetical protein